MLFEKELLDKVNTVQSKYPHFNIQIFLHILQITTRPLGYPPYKQGVNNEYYLDLFTKESANATSTKNSRKLHALMQSLYQVMICFCYIQCTLGVNQLDEELLSLLCKAIDKRMDTTDEERCAEKSLLTMIVQRPREVLNFIAAHHKQLVYINIQQQLEEQITSCGVKQTKTLVAKIAPLTPLEETVGSLSDLTNILKGVNDALKALPSLMKGFAKKECQILMGYYILDSMEEPMRAEWISEYPSLKVSVSLAVRERGKKEITDYIAQRKEESDFCSFLRKHPKAVKLSSAGKFFKALDNKSVILTPDERSALQDDADSRLTSIYTRYKKECAMNG